jgi:hypothetical protein
VIDDILSPGPTLLVGTSLGLALVSLKSREVVCALPFSGMWTSGQKVRSVIGSVMSRLIVGQGQQDSIWIAGQTSLVKKTQVQTLAAKRTVF